jgi:sensor histidine kinase YesM
MINLDYSSKEFSWKRFFWHALFWVFYTVFIATVYGSFEKDYGQRFIEILLLLPIRMLATYFTIYILINRLLLRQRYWIFALSFFSSVLVFSLMQRAVYYYITFPLYYPKLLDNAFMHWPGIFIGMINLYTATIALFSLKFLKQWYENQNDKQSLEIEKSQAELKLLKAQIHPHFLFNTLNNLYALTLKKSDLAPQVVLKLSHLLNYILYECNVASTTLTKEVEMLNNYIELEKIRYGERIKVSFDIDGSIDGVRVAPLLFLPFVENSFKHGASGNLSSPWINIILKIDNDEIVFQIENSNEPDSVSRSYKEGIGLKNVKRRLELQYGDDYELNIENKEERYFVLLCIKNKLF